MKKLYYLYSTDFLPNQLATTWIAVFERGQLVPLMVSERVMYVDDENGAFYEVPLYTGDYWAVVSYSKPYRVTVEVYDKPPSEDLTLNKPIAVFDSIYKAQDWYNGGAL